MSNDKVSPLAGILHEAGFSWDGADEIDAWLDQLPRQGCNSDDVAAALFRWRSKAESRALGRCRERARSVLRGDGSNNNMHDVVGLVEADPDVEGQISLFDTLDERNRLAAQQKCPQQDGK
jgi:hypothetical protein